MGWAVGYDENWKRDIGYGVPSLCDRPGCDERIDRGLAYVCGGEPYGGDEGCGLFFCGKHMRGANRGQRCELCSDGKDQLFEPKPDLPEWVLHKLTHPSWAKARDGLVAPVADAELAGKALDEIRWHLWHMGHCELDDEDREQMRALDAWLRGEL